MTTRLAAASLRSRTLLRGLTSATRNRNPLFGLEPSARIRRPPSRPTSSTTSSGDPKGKHDPPAPAMSRIGQGAGGRSARNLRELYLREEYRNREQWKAVGIFKLMKDMDALAGTIAVKVGFWDFLRCKARILYTPFDNPQQPLVNVEDVAHVPRPVLQKSEGKQILKASRASWTDTAE